MIRVTVELVPFGDERFKKTIGILSISNDGTGDGQIGNYHARLEDDHNAKVEVRVKEHHRRDGAWVLIAKVLDSMRFK